MLKPKIDFYDSVGLGVIICFDSGVIYSNQAGCTACLHPEIEGVYVPLRNDYTVPENIFMSPELELAEYFEGPKNRGSGASRGLDTEDLEFIQYILAKTNLDVIEVDRSKLDQSHEAWVHVTIKGNESKEFPIFRGFNPYPRQAILTWRNSD